jgi:hypothetical protein
MRNSQACIVGVLSWLLGCPAARADAPPRDEFELVAHGETQLELFRRALLPGPNGALVSSATVAPAYQTLLLRARDLDTPVDRDSLDLELTAWGRAWFGELNPERRFDGDLQTLNVRYRRGGASLRLGRQHVAGGAARYSRFDGLEFDADLGSGFSARLYGGFSVLPRWQERPGYYYLGAASDMELRALAETPDPSRPSRWVAGTRVAWSIPVAGAALSFHEQRADGLDRRSLGASARAQLAASASLRADAILELDSQRVADAALWLDWTPTPRVDLSLEYLHVEPALLLSRQSVLSVFSSDSYDETGGFGRVRITEALSLESSGFVQLYASGHPGARGEAALLFSQGRLRRTLLRAGYTRVLTSDNGYNSLRLSLLRRLSPKLSSTVEAYSYLYDRPIRGYRSSSVYAATLGYQANDALNLLLGGSFSRSPYARADAQAELRLAYEFDASTRGKR